MLVLLLLFLAYLFLDLFTVLLLQLLRLELLVLSDGLQVQRRGFVIGIGLGFGRRGSGQLLQGLYWWLLLLRGGIVLLPVLLLELRDDAHVRCTVGGSQAVVLVGAGHEGVALDGVEIVEKFLDLVLLLGEVGLELEQGSIPQPAVEYLSIGELPLLQLLSSLLSMPVISIGDRLADVFPLDHILFIELDNKISAVTRLHLNLLDGLDLNGRLGQLFESAQNVGYVLGVTFGHIGKVVHKPILDDKQSFIGEYTRLATFLHYLRSLVVFGVGHHLHSAC